MQPSTEYDSASGVAAAGGYDWTSSTLGEPAQWPHALRLTLDIMLNAPTPMALLWGPQRSFVFNAAYAELVGPFHPPAPGGHAAAASAPIWTWNRAALDAALDGTSSAFPAQTLTFADGYDGYAQTLDLHYTPIREANGAVGGVLCALHHHVAAAPAAAAPDDGLRILVVEDNLDTQYLVGEMLRAFGHTVTSAERGEDALPLLAAHAFDVLFSDVSLPGMSGVELARRARLADPALNVIFASGYGNTMLKNLDFPFESLLKPYDVDQLQAALRVIAARQRPAAPA